MSNIKTTYHIAISNDDMIGNLDSFSTSTFDKKQLTLKFNEFCLKAREGDIVEYWKSTPKYVKVSMLEVENRKGNLERLNIRGERYWYTDFNLKNLLNTIN